MAADDDDDQPSQPQGDDVGPKIKMGRIGKKKKKGGPEAKGVKSTTEAYTKKLGGLETVDSRPIGGGFNENDIEFMKKAI